MTASPWTLSCIEAAYAWADQHGLPRQSLDLYRVEWAADVDAVEPITDDPLMFWPVAPTAETPDAARWGWLLAVAKELAKYEGTADPREQVLRLQFEAQYGRTIERDQQSRADQRARKSGTESAWRTEVRQIVRSIKTRDFERVLSAIENRIDAGVFVSVDREWEVIAWTASPGDRKDFAFSTLRDFLARHEKNKLPK